jgi:hypothetical protein
MKNILKFLEDTELNLLAIRSSLLELGPQIPLEFEDAQDYLRYANREANELHKSIASLSKALKAKCQEASL